MAQGTPRGQQDMASSFIIFMHDRIQIFFRDAVDRHQISEVWASLLEEETRRISRRRRSQNGLCESLPLFSLLFLSKYRPAEFRLPRLFHLESLSPQKSCQVVLQKWKPSQEGRSESIVWRLFACTAVHLAGEFNMQTCRVAEKLTLKSLSLHQICFLWPPSVKSFWRPLRNYIVLTQLAKSSLTNLRYKTETNYLKQTGKNFIKIGEVNMFGLIQDVKQRLEYAKDDLNWSRKLPARTRPSGFLKLTV